MKGNSINNKCFLDTNLLIYAWDNTEPNKKNKILAFLNNIKKEFVPIISTQTLGEFYNVAVKKIGLTKEQSYVICEEYSKIFPVYEITIENVLHAMQISKKTQFSYWDSLILAMAIDTGCSVLYSEDLNNGQEIEGLKIVNPLCLAI